MSLQKVKDGFKWVFSAGYNFGRTITSQFSDSKWSGLADAGFGALFSLWTIQAGLAIVGHLIVAAGVITTAPLSAAGLLLWSAISLVAGGIMGGNALGFLDAACSKAGLSGPSAFLKTPAAAVSDTAAKGVALAKRTVNGIGTKLSAVFKSSANGKKPSAKAPKAPAPVIKP